MKDKIWGKSIRIAFDLAMERISPPFGKLYLLWRRETNTMPPIEE